MTSLEEKIDFITGSIWLDITDDQRLETCDEGQGYHRTNMWFDVDKKRENI